jgi:hypothetical protein
MKKRGFCENKILEKSSNFVLYLIDSIVKS